MVASSMELEMEVISTEKIKPSTPTPPHLKHHPLSRLDQLLSVFEYRTPLVSFYAAPPTTTVQFLDRLKDSLSKTLSIFYPLAGRLATDAAAIECNDTGVPFIIARAKIPLISFLKSRDRVELVSKFIPDHVVDPALMAVSGWVPLAVQVSIFECGGVALGTHLLHRTIDGISRAHFFKTWANIAAGRNNSVLAPDFKTAVSLFPPCRGPVPSSRPMVLGHVDWPAQDQAQKRCTVKAFGFSARAISSLQGMAKSEAVPHPTRVEAVSGFLWRHLMAAALAADTSKSNMSEKESNCNEHKRSTSRPSALVHSVDMRSHLRPPLPPTVFGKFTTHAIAHLDAQDRVIPSLRELVGLLRQVLSETKDFNKSISMFLGDKGEEYAREHGQEVKKLKHDTNTNTYILSSWSGLDLDFGLGMPVWIGFTGGKVDCWFKNFVVLVHTLDYGIVAWLVLDEQEMGFLESDSEFLAFTSPNTGLILPPKSSL